MSGESINDKNNSCHRHPSDDDYYPTILESSAALPPRGRGRGRVQVGAEYAPPHRRAEARESVTPWGEKGDGKTETELAETMENLTVSIAPFHEQQAPFHEQQAPFYEQKASFHKREAPFHGHQAPYHEQPAPYHEQQAPFHEQQTPFHEQQAPFQEQQAQFHEQQTPFHERQAPLHKQASFHEQPVEQNFDYTESEDFDSSGDRLPPWATGSNNIPLGTRRCFTSQDVRNSGYDRGEASETYSDNGYGYHNVPTAFRNRNCWSVILKTSKYYGNVGGGEFGGWNLEEDGEAGLESQLDVDGAGNEMTVNGGEDAAAFGDAWEEANDFDDYLPASEKKIVIPDAMMDNLSEFGVPPEGPYGSCTCPRNPGYRGVAVWMARLRK